MAALDRPSDVPSFGGGVEWIRKAALAINWLLGPLGRRVAALEAKAPLPFEPSATAPASPVEGQTYYDTATHKVRTYDGTAWQDHF